MLTDGYADGSANKCNGLIREKELEPWDGASTEDGLTAIEDSVVDGFSTNEVVLINLVSTCLQETFSTDTLSKKLI